MTLPRFCRLCAGKAGEIGEEAASPAMGMDLIKRNQADGTPGCIVTMPLFKIELGLNDGQG